MGFLCCICHEDFLTRKEKIKTETDEGTQENGKAPERPIVTTKCGHLFHSDCLRNWFQKQGTEVWTKKECPTCRMSLTVATDLIRIFTTSADDGSPSIEDFKSHISKLENAKAVLSNNLEMSFLRGRDQEKKLAQISRDFEKLQKAYLIEKSKVSQFQSDAAKLKNENEELKNVIINLNKAMTSGNHGIHGRSLGGVHQYQHTINGDGQQAQLVLPMCPYNAGQSGSIQGLQSQGGVGNVNMFSNGHTTSMTISQPQQQLSSWPPSNNNDNGQSASNGTKNESMDFGYMNISHDHLYHNNSNIKSTQNKPEDLTQLNQMFQGIMGLPSIGASSSLMTANSYGDRDVKSFMEENNSSSCPDSDSSRADSETGDHSAKNKFGSTHDGNNNAPSDANGNSTPHNINSRNGLTTTVMADQTPTDEMMDAILNSKSQPVKTDEFFGHKKFTASSASSSRAQKGKTKWKAYEYETPNEDKKMYGKFACKNCKSKWGTSRHIFNQAQTCLRCNEVVFPYDQGPIMTKEELAQQKLVRTRKL